MIKSLLIPIDLSNILYQRFDTVSMPILIRVQISPIMPYSWICLRYSLHSYRHFAHTFQMFKCICVCIAQFERVLGSYRFWTNNKIFNKEKKNTIIILIINWVFQYYRAKILLAFTRCCQPNLMLAWVVLLLMVMIVGGCASGRRCLWSDAHQLLRLWIARQWLMIAECRLRRMLPLPTTATEVSAFDSIYICIGREKINCRSAWSGQIEWTTIYFCVGDIRTNTISALIDVDHEPLNHSMFHIK